MSGEGPWEATYRIRQHDGSYRWFRGRGRTVRSEKGELRMTGMLGDVHQQVLDRQELDQHRQNLTALVAERTASLDAALKEAQRQRSQAEQANRAKSEFLAHMSHELRTPLNGMLGMTELALRVSEDPAQRRYLEVALNSGRSLLRLINDVLDFSRSDSQLPPMEEAPYDLADLLANVVRSLMPTMRPKGLGLRFDWQGEELTRVCGDALRVRQVVTNLVGNACKYTPQGHVAVRAGIERADAVSPTPAWAVVQIEDTGPGIDASRREAVFEPFVQGDPSLTRGHGGAGLGLAISRRLARAMGGDVTLLRSGEEGSVFQFRWPVQLDTAASPPVGHRAGHAWLLSERPAAGDWIAQRLGRMGWTAEVKAGVVTTLNDAGTASVLPQLVLVSEQVMSEPADLAALRAALPAAHIALTVRADWNQPALEEAARLHRMPLAVVPLTPRDLHALLTAAAPLAPEGASATPQRRAQILVVDDNAVNRMVIEAMLGELDAQPLSAEDGAQALACCRHQAPDLVLMDLQMPVMDGLATTRRLRELQREGRLPRFPILALTAHAGDDDRRQALDAGMDDYLTKPLQLPMLEAALRRWIAT
jgi:signal transduction histidine kinase/CheY-like chemotaxis protein